MRPLRILFLLLPLSLAGNSASQLQELKFNKELELSELGKAISDKYEYMESIRQKAIAVLRYEVAKKDLNSQQIKEYGRSIDDNLILFVNRLENTDTLSGFLIAELFTHKKEEPIEDFEVVKFCVIRIINEIRMLKRLIKQYEALEQEHREITQKLIAS